MPEIVLSTLNAKYQHAAFGLRYLLANLGPRRAAAALVEFDLNQRPLDIAEAVLARSPRLAAFGVYIWNVAPTTEVIATLKRLDPALTVVVGGPEVSYEVEQQPITQLADYVITGEADLEFARLCEQVLSGQAPPRKVIAAALPELERLASPYELYTDEDIAHRVIYVEASRGCPFTCEFCLSSLDIPVRQFPLPALLTDLERLLARGVRHFKFVDRTFNLNLAVSRALLEFFLERLRPGMFLHFEMIPDRLPEALRQIIARFPAGVLQFEVGIQTFNPAVARLISRRQDHAKIEENLRFLRCHTGVHLHADLIAGLPGETVDSFAAGFDRLVALGPQEIQVGILKRLRGTPIVRHDTEWGMIYSPSPPYEVLQTRLLDFPTLQRLRRFARYWDLVANSGNFVTTCPRLWTAPRPPASATTSPLRPGAADGTGAETNSEPTPGSPFGGFMRFADWLYGQVGRQHAIALHRLAEALFHFLTAEVGLPPATVAAGLVQDYERAGRGEIPPFLQSFAGPRAARPHGGSSRPGLKRQRRHQHAPGLRPGSPAG